MRRVLRANHVDLRIPESPRFLGLKIAGSRALSRWLRNEKMPAQKNVEVALVFVAVLQGHSTKYKNYMVWFSQSSKISFSFSPPSV